MTLHIPQPHFPLPSGQPPVTQRQACLTSDLFGTLIMEITGPHGEVSAPELDGWTLRVWPVARLGDATLEAQPLEPHLDEADLRRSLKRAGYQVLGPVRVRRAASPGG